MNDTQQLITRYLDDRESLSETEWSRLVDALRESPELAVEVKEQLLLDELLAQRMALDRRQFVAQVDQRIRDYLSGEEELVRQVEEVRQLAAGEFEIARSRRRRARRMRFLAALAAAVLIAAGVGIWTTIDRSTRLAVIDVGEGHVTLFRDGREISVTDEVEVQPGDRVETASDEFLTVKYPDGTTVEIIPDSLIEFGATSTRDRKLMVVHRGSLSAKVTPQQASAAMVFATGVAEAEVLGTELWLSSRGDVTRLDVTEGRVRIARQADGESVLISANESALISPRQVTSRPIDWPSGRDGIAFLFESEDRANLARQGTSGMLRTCRAVPRGRARLDHAYAMQLGGGAFVAPLAGDRLLETCRRSGEFSIEATLQPARLDQPNRTAVISFCQDAERINFLLAQQQGALKLLFRTSRSPNGTPHEQTVAALNADAPQHVVVTYRTGRLVCYVDGKQVFETLDVQGDFVNWTPCSLLFGDTPDSSHDWAGTLEGVAIYDRFLEAEEVQQNAAAVERHLQDRVAPGVIVLKAALLESSRRPSPSEIAPGRAALAVEKYRVTRVVSGQFSEPEVYVARWAVLDGASQPATAAGGEVLLQLERFDQNPQLARFLCTDDFRGGEAANTVRYYHAGD